MERKKVTPQDLLAKKQQGKKIVRVVCYDYPMALLADQAEEDCITIYPVFSIASPRTS